MECVEHGLPGIYSQGSSASPTCVGYTSAMYRKPYCNQYLMYLFVDVSGWTTPSANHAGAMPERSTPPKDDGKHGTIPTGVLSAPF